MIIWGIKYGIENSIKYLPGLRPWFLIRLLLSDPIILDDLPSEADSLPDPLPAKISLLLPPRWDPEPPEWEDPAWGGGATPPQAPLK